MLGITSRLSLAFVLPQSYGKKRFYSSALRRFELVRPNDILTHGQSIIERIQTYGFIIFRQNYDTSNRTFRNICEHFGYLWNRPSDKDGISFVVDKASQGPSNCIRSNLTFYPHTDGAYLDGIVFQEEKYVRTLPPKFVALECVTSALAGGESILIDGKNLLEQVMHRRPSLLPALFAKSITFFRGNQIANRVSIFDKKEQRYSIRYSYDQEMLISEELCTSIKVFNNDFVLNEQYHLIDKLLENEIIVMDNLRMLHGRKEFSGSRKLRRAWVIDGHVNDILVPAQTPDGTFYQKHEDESVNKSLTMKKNYLQRMHTSNPLSIAAGFIAE
jgi:hypothetical protein